MVDLDKALRFLGEVAGHYERSAPTVRDYAHDLYRRIDAGGEDVRLVELVRVGVLREEGVWLTGSGAANVVYHLMHALGLDVTGHAGF